MYSVSQKYLEAMKRPVQRHRMQGTVAEVPFSEADILAGSFSITGQCSDSSNVQIGQVYITELKATFMRGLNLSRYSLKGAQVIPYFGLRLDTGVYEYIPLGVFTISDASWGESGVQVTAYDNISLLERSYTGTKLIGTPYEIYLLACESCGIEPAMYRTDFDSFANGGKKLQLYADNDIETWRDVMSWVAQTCGCNVFADRDGKLVLRPYRREVTDSIDTEHRFTGCSFDDYETKYTGLSVVNIEKQETNYYSDEVDDGTTYNLGSNPFLQTASEGTVEEMCREVLDALHEITYVPFSVTMIGNPAYDLMDVFRFTDGLADGEKISCMTKYTFVYNGKYSIQGVGQNPALSTSRSKSDKNLSGLMEQMKSITSSINKLIYDFNTGPITVRQREQTLGMINYYISEDADVEGHFLMNYTASESTHLILRFYDQAVEELYSPVEVDIHEGEGTVTIPHAYLTRSVGVHAVYATAQCLSGELYIDTRGVFFTIDAGNFAEAVDDISMDVRDISMRQLLESNGPDQIWIIGIEDGELLVSKRAYSETYNSNPEWEGVYAPGKGKDAAIEFDGDWVLRSGSQKFTLETEDQPWYFWVDMDDRLVAQHGEDEESRLTLDTGVSAVSACKGYSSIMYPEQDQGLVVAYIKDGYPYYIQYAYDSTLGAKRWYPMEQLTDVEVTDLRIHRLNDYRLGFELTTPEKNLWIYTARTYVGQAVPKEKADVFLTDKAMFLYAASDTDLTVEYGQDISADSQTLYIFVSKPVRYFYSWQDVISFDEESITYGMVDSVTIENTEDSAVITIRLNEPPHKLITTVTVNPGNTNDLQAIIKDWGYIRAPKVVLTYDTTIYRYFTIPGEECGIRNSGTDFAYEEIVKRRLALTTETGEIQNTSTGMQYALIEEIRQSIETETCEIENTAENMNYEQVAPSPI